METSVKTGWKPVSSSSYILGKRTCLFVGGLMIAWQKQPLKEAGNELGIIGLCFLPHYLTVTLTNVNKLGDRGKEGWKQASRREIAIKHPRSPACERSTCIAPISHSREGVS